MSLSPLPAFVPACALALVLAGPVFAQSTETTESSESAATETTSAETTGAETTSAGTTTPQVTATADTVMAVVDEKPITLGEIIAVRQSLPEQYQQLPDEVLITALVQQMSDQQLLANAAYSVGLQNSTTFKLAMINQERAVLADAFMAKELLKRVNENTLAAAYQERFVAAEPEQEARAAHILVETEEEAKALKVKMDAGADFAALAAEHGSDGTASRGGDLGWFAKEQMVPEFAEAAFAMQPGEVSDPVESPFGWHLIKLDEMRDRPVPTLEEVQEQLIGELTEAAQNAIITELRDSSTVTQSLSDVPAAAVRDDSLIAE